MGACARSVRVAPVLKFLAARRGVGAWLEQERYRGTERRKQLRDERRLELFFRTGAALTLSLGAGTGLQLEDTRHRLALCHRASMERMNGVYALISVHE